MSVADSQVHDLAAQKREYKYGFVTDIEQEFAPPGLNEDTIRFISAKKNEPQWLLDWRLKAFAHWQTMKEPDWVFLPYGYEKPDYQAISYYAAPKAKPKSLDEVDPALLETYEKLGIPLSEQKVLLGVEGAEASAADARGGNVAVDAVFDSVSRRHDVQG
jgi:Fe-S cluster assembly protein SufB